ncbi:hypothetical protein BT63DRAFT_443762 [Microthyrium microscopicum]|uniref:Uncharacterized protein n=1 Tax=Microthyrium microscopicum TaxID=703497 RepID=A0A6A6TZH4_9PEZI|nr:hypothetical protein BT63DRAFT_443762 [Microthyrium microscopicum]
MLQVYRNGGKIELPGGSTPSNVTVCHTDEPGSRELESGRLLSESRSLGNLVDAPVPPGEKYWDYTPEMQKTKTLLKKTSFSYDQLWNACTKLAKLTAPDDATTMPSFLTLLRKTKERLLVADELLQAELPQHPVPWCGNDPFWTERWKKQRDNDSVAICRADYRGMEELAQLIVKNVTKSTSCTDCSSLSSVGEQWAGEWDGE